MKKRRRLDWQHLVKPEYREEREVLELLSSLVEEVYHRDGCSLEYQDFENWTLKRWRGLYFRLRKSAVAERLAPALWVIRDYDDGGSTSTVPGYARYLHGTSTINPVGGFFGGGLKAEESHPVVLYEQGFEPWKLVSWLLEFDHE